MLTDSSAIFETRTRTRDRTPRRASTLAVSSRSRPDPVRAGCAPGSQEAEAGYSPIHSGKPHPESPDGAGHLLGNCADRVARSVVQPLPGHLLSRVRDCAGTPVLVGGRRSTSSRVPECGSRSSIACTSATPTVCSPMSVRSPARPAVLVSHPARESDSRAAHAHYRHFIDYGDARGYRTRLMPLRNADRLAPPRDRIGIPTRRHRLRGGQRHDSHYREHRA